MTNSQKPTVIAHPETGAAITPSTNNPEWGTFRVDSVTPVFSNGVLNMNKRTAFVRGRIADLEALGLTIGMQLSGKIIRRESFSPFYEGQNPKAYPTNTVIDGRDVSGQSVLKNGKETYLESIYTEDPSAKDEWVGDDSLEVSADVSQALSQQEI